MWFIEIDLNISVKINFIKKYKIFKINHFLNRKNKNLKLVKK